jgi:hypothetical protein
MGPTIIVNVNDLYITQGVDQLADAVYNRLRTGRWYGRYSW